MNNQLYTRIEKSLAPIYSSIEKVGLFGSYLRDPITANDIDIMIWVNDKDIKKCIKLMKKGEICDSLNIENVSCHYTNIPEVEIEDEDKEQNEIPLHITWLPSDDYKHVNCQLWNKNRDKVKIIYSKNTAVSNDHFLLI